jgi:hypothetical protein
LAHTSSRPCSASILVAVSLSGVLAGCQRGPEVTTSVVFDDVTRTIITSNVTCAKQPDGGLVILVKEKATHTVRVLLSQRGRLVVKKVGLRYEGMAGYVEDAREVTGTKVDDTYTVSGRMPPNQGESQWHTFKIQTTCPGYLDASPSTRQPLILGP